MTFRYPATGLADIMNSYYRSGGRSFRVALLQDATSLTETSSIIDFLSREPLSETGYSRPSLVFGEFVFNPAEGLVECPEIAVAFTAGAAPIQFEGAMILGNASATANKVVATISGNPSTFGIANHGLVANDRIFFTSENAAPAGLSLNQIYHVVSSGLTTNSFQISATQGGAAIGAVGSSWAGQLICRYANGILLPWDLREDDGNGNRIKTIQPSQTHSVLVKLRLGVGS